MRAYKTVVWDGQEYSVPVEMKWLTVDSDGEINVWNEQPIVHHYTPTSITGFWRAPAVKNTNRVTISAGHTSYVDFEGSLTEI